MKWYHPHISTYFKNSKRSCKRKSWKRDMRDMSTYIWKKYFSDMFFSTHCLRAMTLSRRHQKSFASEASKTWVYSSWRYTTDYSLVSYFFKRYLIADSVYHNNLCIWNSSLLRNLKHISTETWGLNLMQYTHQTY